MKKFDKAHSEKNKPDAVIFMGLRKYIYDRFGNLKKADIEPLKKLKEIYNVKVIVCTERSPKEVKHRDMVKCGVDEIYFLNAYKKATVNQWKYNFEDIQNESHVVLDKTNLRNKIAKEFQISTKELFVIDIDEDLDRSISGDKYIYRAENSITDIVSAVKHENTTKNQLV